jgi:hypothetical protein
MALFLQMIHIPSIKLIGQNTFKVKGNIKFHVNVGELSDDAGDTKSCQHKFSQKLQMADFG